MPIAHCVVSPACRHSASDVIALWSTEAGIASDQMTINFIRSEEQVGNSYAVMATLYLPSLWSKDSISSLQLGLARALATYFEISIQEVHVITRVVDSGLVVEGGKEQSW